MNSTQKQSSLNRAAVKGKFPSSRISACAVAVALLAGANSKVLGAPSTVGILNPTPPAVGVVDSPANVGNANFLTVAAMTAAVPAAFNNNTGGVIDWEGANGWIANGQNALFQTVTYGTSQASSLTLTRNNGGGANTFGPTTLGGSPTTSGTNYVGFQTSGSPITLAFSSALSDWGMTQLNRSANRTVTFSFTLADTTVINYAAQIQDPLANNTDVNNWYGFHAPANNPLVQVSFLANGFTRWDDMAFIVAVPEPSSMALVGMGLAALVAFRRRHS